MGVSDVLLKLGGVLSEFTVKEVSSTSRLTELRVSVDDRESARQRIQDFLDKNRITYGPAPISKSSFIGTEIKTQTGNIQLIYKPVRSAGSGAGAALTKLSESAQCVYAAVSFGLGRKITNADITQSNVSKFASLFDVDEDINKILNDLPEDWIKSSVLGANKLFEKFSNKGKFVFHRGSSTIETIESNFKRIQKIEGIRMDLNKWSPADIYMVRNDFDITCLNEEKTILGLNQCMQQRIENNTLIGVSLKKIIGVARIELKNVFRDMKTTKKYIGYTYSDKSMDGYINLDGGTKIQFRSFGGKQLTGFQGEVKGAQANQGKISLGPVNMILKSHGLKTVPTDAANKVRTSKQGVFNEIKSGYKKFTSLQENAFNDIIENEQDPWLYSKLQVTQLIDIIESMRDEEKRNQLVEDLYLYASSQSKFSAPYYKME